nr:hypothetical protein [Burkholderia ubonensis]
MSEVQLTDLVIAVERTTHVKNDRGEASFGVRWAEASFPSRDYPENSMPFQTVVGTCHILVPPVVEGEFARQYHYLAKQRQIGARQTHVDEEIVIAQLACNVGQRNGAKFDVIY